MLGLICALKCEAQGFIEFYSLKPYPQKTFFPVYYSDEVYLIISGIGKINAAAATCYLHMLSGEQAISVWLNVGVGGHPYLDLGQARFAHQIKDAANSFVYYPVFTEYPQIPTETFLTVDQVERHYNDLCVYEMESSGFYQTAIRFSIAEFVHAVKVISDNKSHSPEKNAEQVYEWIKYNVPLIAKSVQSLLALSKILSDANETPELLSFIEKWHFTVSEKYQLKRVLQRWKCLYPSKNVWDDKLFMLKKAKDVIHYLNQKVEGCSTSFT